ncbi:MAG TPA: hypothetical protein VFN35_07085 [Ktedonobacteraceae bacterium]|nr:hypothetical protein [Ktedonobacteraceae bacterium]
MSHPQESDASGQADPDGATELLADPGASLHQRLTVAGNPSTSENMLGHLAQDQDAQVRQAVAANPNTSWEALQWLAREFPGEFLANPLGALYILTRPELISTDEHFWGGLLREALIPSLWWNWLRSHPTLSTGQAVRLHIQSAGETAYPYGMPRKGEERELLILTELLVVAASQDVPLPSLSGQQMVSCERIVGEHLLWLAHCADEEMRQAVALLPQTPVEALHQLAQDQDTMVRMQVAENERTPLKVLYTLAGDAQKGVRRGVAGNARTPSGVLRMLAQDQDADVRGDVAWNIRTPLKVLEALACDSADMVRRALAWNRRTPGKVLRVLAQDEEAAVRRDATESFRLPVEVLYELAQDEAWFVRRDVASLARTPSMALQKLARDEDVYIRESVSTNPRLPGELLRILAYDEEPGVRRNIAVHTRTPGELLCVLAQDGIWYVREAVAFHPRTPVRILRNLARDPMASVRKTVASHPRLPLDSLQILVQDEDETVQCRARVVQKLLAEIKEPLREAGWRKKITELLLNELHGDLILDAPIEKQLAQIVALDVSRGLRQAIIAVLAEEWSLARVYGAFTMPETDFSPTVQRDRQANARAVLAAPMPALALQKLATSPSWEVRYLVALHLNTPWEIRQHLSQDGNRYVRAIARAIGDMSNVK